MYGTRKGGGGGGRAAAGELDLSWGHQLGGGGMEACRASSRVHPPGTHLHGSMLGTLSKAISRQMVGSYVYTYM